MMCSLQKQKGGPNLTHMLQRREAALCVTKNNSKLVEQAWSDGHALKSVDMSSQ